MEGKRYSIGQLHGYYYDAKHEEQDAIIAKYWKETGFDYSILAYARFAEDTKNVVVGGLLVVLDPRYNADGSTELSFYSFTPEKYENGKFSAFHDIIWVFETEIVEKLVEFLDRV